MASAFTAENGTGAETPKPDTESEKREAEAAKPAAEKPPAPVSPEKKWPGWPGDCVFRLIVPVLKVGSVIGRKGDIIKKMCEETKARIRVLDAPVGTPDRIVLISGKEETEAPLSPAMDAVIRVFKRVNGFPESEGESIASIPFCSIRLLVPSMQATSLIGKQGSVIKKIQETTGCTIRVLTGDEVSMISGNSDERVVDLQGEALKVLKALEAVIGHLRKFLVDHSVLPLFEKTNNVAATQERQVESRADKTMLHGISNSQPGLGGDYPFSIKRETLFLDREPQLSSAGFSLYGRDLGLSTTRPPTLGHTGGPIVTQMSQTMQIPLVYAEDLIGVGGTNIAYIRRTSGAILTVQESRGLPDEITVEIKGTSLQVHTAQQLIQDCVESHKESMGSSYGRMESGYSQSQIGSSSASSYGGYGYGASTLTGGYPSYRM